MEVVNGDGGCGGDGGDEVVPWVEMVILMEVVIVVVMVIVVGIVILLGECDIAIIGLTRQIWGIWKLHATGLVILLKIGLIFSIFFVPCDLEIWSMTSKNKRAHLLYYIKLCASFQIHRGIQTGVTVRKRSIWVKIGDFLSRRTLKFDGWS